MTIKEELELPVDAPLIEDVDGSLTVELDKILESSETDEVTETATVETTSEEAKPEGDVVTEDTGEIADDAPVVTEEVANAETSEQVSEGKDSDDDEDDKDEDDEDDEGVKEEFEVSLTVGAGDIDLSEDIDAIFGDESLTEEFKTKATGIFEAAVTAKVNETISSYVEKVNTESKRLFTEATEKNVEAVAERLESFLDTVVENWVDNNREAIESKLMVKLSESFMSGLKNVFESHYVNTDSLQVDVIKSLSEENEGLSSRLSEQLDHNVKLKSAVISERRKRIIENSSNGLTDEQKEKFLKLSEAVVFSSSDDFKQRLEDIKEAYFEESVETEIIVNSVEIDDTEVVTESVETPVKVNAGVSKTLKYLSK